MKTRVYYRQVVLEDWSDSLESLLSGIDGTKVFALTFFAEVADEEYHSLLQRVRTVVYSLLGKEVPVTLVPQILALRGSIAVEVYEQEGAAERMQARVSHGVHCQRIDTDEYSLLMIEGIPSTEFSTGVLKQSEEIYDRLYAVLSENGFEVSDIVRQWNYIGDITGERNHLQNYQEYNNARTAFYRRAEWRNGYPAATGIGASTKGIIVSCVAMKPNNGSCQRIFPINNPLQTAAHVYSTDVLVGTDGQCGKSTPKFERAKVVVTHGGEYCFVSGTAAIRGERSNCSLRAADQIRQTIENVQYLVSDENLSRHGCEAKGMRLTNLRVYIKDRADYDCIRQCVEEAFPAVPAVYFITEVCRKELLVEIEGICQPEAGV